MRFFLEVTGCQSGGSSPISWECLTFLVAPPGRRSTLATAPRQLLSGNIERRGKGSSRRRLPTAAQTEQRSQLLPPTWDGLFLFRVFLSGITHPTLILSRNGISPLPRTVHEGLHCLPGPLCTYLYKGFEGCSRWTPWPPHPRILCLGASHLANSHGSVPYRRAALQKAGRDFRWPCPKY